VGGPTGNGATQATASTPTRAPALALVDSRGEVVRLTESFRAGFALEGSPHLSIWDFVADPDQRSRLGRVLEGVLLRADLALPSAAGSVAAEAEAVLDAAVMRHALLTVTPRGADPEPRSGADVLLGDPSLDDSPAIVWIKDLGGRYLRINRRYTERLGIDDASIRGQTDAELPPAHVVAEPRLYGHHGSGGEPAQLEYTVDATGGRPGLTVLRFPIHDLDGRAVAVCGVAAALADAGIARSEAERLLRIERWAGLSVAAIRAEVLEEWQLAEVAASEPSVATDPGAGPRPAASAEGSGASEPAGPAATAGLDRLRGELEAARIAIAQLEGHLSAERAAKAQLEALLADEATRSAELDERFVTATRRAEELVSGTNTERAQLVEVEAALAAERARAEALAAEIEVARVRAEAAEQEVAAARVQVEAAEQDVAAARVEVEGAGRDTDLARARAEAAEREVAAAAARTLELENGSSGAATLERELAGQRGRAEKAERDMAALRVRAEKAERDVAALRVRAEKAERGVALARARVDELQRDGASTAAVAEQADAEHTARVELEHRLGEAQRRAEEAERALAAERAATARTRGELVARSEQAEAALGDAQAACERATAAAERANALAELSRGRAEGLETALASAREVKAESGTALERAETEIASLNAALETIRAENQAAREEAHAATERLDLERRQNAERRQRERHEPADPSSAGPVAGAPAVPPTAIHLPAAATAPQPVPSSPEPKWSHGAQRALAASLADATEWRAGLKDALRVVGAEGGWDVVVAWCPDERARSLRCSGMWMSAPDRLNLFETVTWQRRLSPAASAVGHVAAGDHAHWFGDLTAAEDAQLKAAAGEGMRAALHVPIRHGGETSGVLELLTSQSVASNPETIAAMEAVGLQLAHFEYLLRRGAEPRWRLGRL
jgi:hypothetical protein